MAARTKSFSVSIGERFSKLVIKEYYRRNGVTYCLCLCDCGKTKEVAADRLRRGKKRSCGCKIFEDLTGRVFDKLTVIEYLGTKTVRCLCVCGKDVVVETKSLFNCRNIKSCGCVPLKGSFFKLYPHCYSRFTSILMRCTNQKCGEYHNYGGRGITIFPEWLEPDTGRLKFIGYMLSIYPNMEDLFAEGLEIDRIDNDGNYEPGNLRITTKTVNTRNRRCAVKIQVNDEILPIIEAAEKYSFAPIDTVRQAVAKGASLEDTLFSWKNPHKLTKIPLNLDVLKRQVPFVIKQYFYDNEIFPASSICEVFESLIDHLKAAGHAHIYLDSNFQPVDNVVEFKRK